MTMPEQATRPAKIELTSQKYYDELSAWYARQSPQTVAVYNALGGTDTEACANCLFFMSPNNCTVVESWPVAISPTGRSKFWTAIPEYRPEPMEVIIVDRPAAEEKAVSAPPYPDPSLEPGVPIHGGKGLLATLAGAIKALFDHENGRLLAGSPDIALKTLKEPNGLQLFKDANDAWRWFAWVSNKWRDRDGEIIEDAAHKDFVAYLDGGGEMPEAWLWHTPGTKWGRADWAEYADGFLMMSGTVDAGSEAIAEALSKEAVGVSHGFQLTYSAKDVIGWYRSFEISALPPAVAANVWTSLELVRKEAAAMSFSAQKRQYLEAKIGREKTDELERGTGDLAKSLADLGVDYKDVPSDEPQAALSLKEISDAVTKAIGDSPAVKAIADSVTGLGSTVEGLNTTVKSLDERLKAVERTDAEKTAAFFVARAGGGPAAMARASESAKTVMTDEEKAAAQKDAPDAAFAWLESALPTAHS